MMLRTFAYLFVILASASALHADLLTCSVAHYKASPGLTAAVAGNAATITWDGDNRQELRLRLTVNGGTPTIEELAIRLRDIVAQLRQVQRPVSHANPNARAESK